MAIIIIHIKPYINRNTIQRVTHYCMVDDLNMPNITAYLVHKKHFFKIF